MIFRNEKHNKVNEKCSITRASLRFEKDRQNIDSFRVFIEKFSNFF